MSAEAVGHVYRHSPYKGAAFAVHQAIADSANDQHDYEFWMTAETLATKARLERRQVGRALATLVDDGWLQVIEQGGGRGRPGRYRFLFRDDAGVVYETRKPRQAVAVTRNETATTTTDTATSTTSTELDTATSTPPHKEEPKSLSTQRSQLTPSSAEAFDRFWASCPKKVGKGAARRAWTKRVRDGADTEVLIAGMQRYASWVVAALQVGEVESMRFVVHPSTWLNEEREDDHLTVPGKAAASVSRVERARAEHAKRYGHAV